MTVPILQIFECSSAGAIGEETGEQFTVPEYHVNPLNKAVGAGQLIGVARFSGSIANVVQFPWMARRVLFNFGKY